MVYWIWLSQKLGYGSLKARALIDIYNDAKAIFELDEKKLIQHGFLNSLEIKKLSEKSLTQANRIIKECKDKNIGIVSYNDKCFPKRLKEISNPPMCLYYKGEFLDFDSLLCISVVGQRRVSDYGRLAAWSLSARLTLGGAVIVSGGAIGTDCAAHTGALDVGGKTVAFLACGINFPYLKQNENLRNDIIKNGCLISEYPPNEKLYKHNFHARNRLISGISLGTVVVEAPKQSGALITAKYANEQGRDVFVLTSRPDDPNYAGTNSLLKDGARPVFDVSDVFNEYSFLFSDKININKAKSINLSDIYRRKQNSNIEKKKNSLPKASIIKEKNNFSKKNIEEGLSKNAKIVYNFIDMNIFTIDDLLNCGLSFESILASLTELEILGYLKAIPGGRYSIV